jgi:hypothetical protein
VLRHRFLGSPAAIADSECVRNDLLTRLGKCGLANVNRFSGDASEHDGDSIPTGELAAYPLPAQMEPGNFELRRIPSNCGRIFPLDARKFEPIASLEIDIRMRKLWPVARKD